MSDESVDCSEPERFNKEIDELIELAETTSSTLQEIPLLEPVIEWLAELIQNVEECRQVLPKLNLEDDPILDDQEYDSLKIEAESLSDWLRETDDIENDIDCDNESCEPFLDALHDMIRLHLKPVRKKAWHVYHVLILAE